jgi:hypothetical protein
MRNYAKVIKASDVKRDTKREQEMQKMAHGYAVLSNTIPIYLIENE